MNFKFIQLIKLLLHFIYQNNKYRTALCNLSACSQNILKIIINLEKVINAMK